MHQLILLRHAKAVRGNAEGSDHDRELTPDGKRAAAAMGAAMRKLGLTPDVILVSSALRTQETLDALEPWEDRPNIETNSTLYMASFMQIRDLLRELPETVRSVLVIGHNPGIHELAQLLASARPYAARPAAAQPSAARPEARTDAAPVAFMRLEEEYPTASLVEFLIATPWHKLGPAGASLQRFIQPADLPAATRNTV